MSRTFLVQMDGEGRPEPMFCSVCHEFQEELVYFLADRVEVAMCADCIEYAGRVILEVRDRVADSRA